MLLELQMSIIVTSPKTSSPVVLTVIARDKDKTE